MRLAPLALALLLPPQGHIPLTAPAKEPKPDYPVHLTLQITKGGAKNGGWQGYGRGTVLPDSPDAKPRTFSYTYTCEGQLRASESAEDFYQARWKVPNLKLDVLTEKPGTTHIDHCEIAVTLTPAS